MAITLGGVELSFVLAPEITSKADLYIHVIDVEKYHHAFSKKIEKISPLVNSGYGMRDFSIHDPWGHHLVFGEALEKDRSDTLNPSVSDVPYVFVTTQEQVVDIDEVLLRFKEKEGTTLIISQEAAEKHGFRYDGLWAHISLGINSDLDMVGLTAMFSTALAAHDIPCNVVAAYHHDHIFVPVEMKDRVITILSALKI